MVLGFADLIPTVFPDKAFVVSFSFVIYNPYRIEGIKENYKLKKE